MTDRIELGPQQLHWNRDYVFDILRDLGIHHIFGVPGTNEIPIIDGTLYPENKVQYIECLHENIAMGAAMGYASMTGKPGVVVVHVTPGIAHGIGNLFNAWRSRIPLVVLCCQQHNELVTQEPLLESNTVDLAREYTKWAHELRTPKEFPLVLQRAFKEAMAPPTGPVFVSIPWEFMMRSIQADDRIQGVTRISPHFTGDMSDIQQAASLLAQAQNPIILAGDGRQSKYYKNATSSSRRTTYTITRRRHRQLLTAYQTVRLFSKSNKRTRVRTRNNRKRANN